MPRPPPPEAALTMTGYWLRRGADERDVAGLADLGEVGVLREEAVAGMDAVHVGDLGRADDGRDVQIALLGSRSAHADRFVRQPHVEAVAVRFRIDGDRPDVHFFAGPYDPDGDLPPVGDEDF